LPELALIAGTRAALGAGIALLCADRLAPEQRKAVGWTLFAVGALSTIPLAFEVLGGRRTQATELRLSEAPAFEQEAPSQFLEPAVGPHS
jgi:hypothetical protein